jgi:recombination associated protein RdgC
MMIKNVIAYIVTPGFRFKADILGRHPARQCGAFEKRTVGFAAPFDHATDGLIHAIGGDQVICMETEDKLLPSQVVTEAVNSVVEQIEEEQGRKVGRKEMRDIKERVIDELLPKAFVQHRKTIGILTGQYFIINSSSSALADEMMSALAHAHDSGVPLRPVNTNVAPVSAMTGWVASRDAPAGFTLDDTLELRQASDTAAAIRYVNNSIDGDEITEHIASGKLAVKLGMTFNNEVSFVLNSNFHIKRIAILDVIKEQQEEELTLEESQDADLVLSAGYAVKILDALIEAHGGLFKPEADLLEAA